MEKKHKFYNMILLMMIMTRKLIFNFLITWRHSVDKEAGIVAMRLEDLATAAQDLNQWMDEWRVDVCISYLQAIESSRVVSELIRAADSCSTPLRLTTGVATGAVLIDVAADD